MTERFRTKPSQDEETYEAVKYTGDNNDEILEFIKDAKNFKVLEGNIICMANDHIGWFLRKTDYVCKLSDGRFIVRTWSEVNYKSVPLKG